MAYRYWDKEKGGWVVNIPGTDRSYVQGSAEGNALEATWKKDRAEKVAKHLANVGNWQQYQDGSLEEFASLLNKDHWYWGRLAGYANNIMNGDEYSIMQFNHQFNPSSANSARGQELTNRYIALLNQGYTNQEIMGAGYGNDGHYWASWDKQDTNSGGNNTGGGSTGGNDGSNTGGGMLGGPINHQPRRERKGTWGSGYKDGGYSLLGEENQAMRQAIGEQLEKKLLG